MKRTRRTLLLILSLALCLVLAVSALAEGALSALYQAGCTLLFDTDNATLTAHATFSYDGELFKTLDGTYIQDDVNSNMRITLTTPKEDGTEHIGGYTVIANGGTVCSIDSSQPQIYRTSSNSSSTSILSTSVLRQALTGFGAALIDVLEPGMGQHITASTIENGTQYHIQLASGDSPAIADAALTLFSQLAAQRFYDIDYDHMDTQAASSAGTFSFYYESWEELFNHLYRTAYNEDVPDEFYAAMWDPDDPNSSAYYDRYLAINQQIDDISQQLQAQYNVNDMGKGVAVIHADGSYDYWPTRDAYLIETNQQYAIYDNYDLTFRQYYEQQTGTALSTAEFDAIMSTNNEELYNVYSQMREEMNLYYESLARADSKASAIYVKTDGSTQLIYDINTFMHAYYSRNNYTSVKNRILNTMRTLKLDQADVTVALDAQGRIVAGEGTVRIAIIDDCNMQHALDIAFTATAEQYGTSAIAAFDPDEFGVISAQEYYANYESYATIIKETPAPEVPVEETPEFVVFDGVKYQVTLENAGNG